MRLPIPESTLLLDTRTDVHKFGVQVDAKLFSILTEKLYKNPIRAVIREISCNAVDAHKMVNNPRPFEVYLPNALSPTFKVRDYGPGLSHYSVLKEFNVVGLSTKENDATQIGALGLGCKSPYAYTDSFTVVSYQGGVARTYNALMDAGKEPDIGLTSEIPTDEPDGLEVTFPVASQDFETFRREAESVFLTFFDNRPIVYGAELAFPGLVELSEDILWQPIDTSAKFFAVQGGIAYPVVSSMVKLPDGLKGVFYFLCPMESISFTPSREEMTDTEDNVRTVQGFFERLEGVIRTQIRQQVQQASSEAYLKSCFQGWNIGAFVKSLPVASKNHTWVIEAIKERFPTFSSSSTLRLSISKDDLEASETTIRRRYKGKVGHIFEDSEHCPDGNGKIQSVFRLFLSVANWEPAKTVGVVLVDSTKEPLSAPTIAKLGGG